MCGIAGMAGVVDRELLQSMLAVTRHRGPDDTGIFVSGNTVESSVGLGNNRLSIIDLSHAGHQPMSNEDESVWVAYNGEVFDFSKLREELVRRGHKFKSHTDTEVIVHLYEDCGAGMVDHLNGMFAIAIWDSKRQELLLFRDRVGIKPVYYSQIGPRLYFCSEIKGLLQAAEISREIDPIALGNYLDLQYVPAPRTLFKSIRKLEPGHFLSWKKGKVSITRFWDATPRSPRHGSVGELSAQFYSTLKDSVRRQLVSDVPVGLFLSGGLDSSAILACAASVHRGKLKAYNIAYPERHGRLEQSADDAFYAAVVAEKFGAELHQIKVEPDVVNLLPKVAYYLDDPVGDPHTVSTYLICAAAKPEVTVLLSGQGADELFGGYRVHMIHRFAKLLSVIPASLRRGVLQRLVRYVERNRNLIPLTSPGLLLGICRVSEKYIQAAGRDPSDQFARARSFCDRGELNDLLAPGLRCDAMETDWPKKLEELFSSVKDAEALDQVLYADVKTFLPDLNLNVADKLSMAASVEVRVPFLDNEVLDFALQLPPQAKISGLTQKRILRRAMQKRLPEGVLRRRKAAFGLPVRSWMQNELRPMMEDLLSEETIRRRGMLNPVAVREMVRQTTSGERDFTIRLWALMTLELWQQAYTDGNMGVGHGLPANDMVKTCGVLAG
jgi:asparagine synthase (glutamine-hydrolysing)